MIYCYICYSLNTDTDFICDRCDEYYCEDCSYTFSLHYQYQGGRCYLCADQSRRKNLELSTKRDNKLSLIEKLHKTF